MGNYHAAIEAYQKAAQLNPGNREAMKQLGVAYEKQGLTTKAIEQFDRYLERFEDDPDIAFKQADYLGWSRYEYRRADAIRYYRMGLSRREDLERRHRLARLLAQDRAQLDEALEQYRLLLAARSEQPEWRAEYRELLLWDERHLKEAIVEFHQYAKEKPDDMTVQHTLARLIARDDPRSDEAVSRYAELVRRRPADAALRLEYAELLSRDRSRRSEAIREYQNVLARNPRPSTREALADLLSEDASRRSEALEQYRILLRDEPNDLGVRLKYARLLSARREDTPAAIEQYEIVVQRDPDNATAHAGLAACYAWVGDRDRALYHSNLAARYGARSPSMAELRKDLLRGREPRVEPLARGLVQRGKSRSRVDGVVLGVGGRGDVTPFLTLRGETGFEDYWRGSHDTASGFARVDGDYRLDPAREMGLGVGYHTLGNRSLTARAAYKQTGELWTVSGGYDRSLRYDSYVALVGDRVDGREIGSARENRFRLAALYDHEGRQWEIEPYGGLVDARGVAGNPFVGLRSRGAYRVYQSDRFELSPTLEAEIYHYRFDAFAIAPGPGQPRPGGYFSPQLFVQGIPGLKLATRWGTETFLDLEGGPAAQLVKEGGGATHFEIGGQGRLSFVTLLRPSLYWTFETDVTSLGDAYTRVGASTSLTFKF
jgi:tetratricopeptide (TPR) repeat protein